MSRKYDVLLVALLVTAAFWVGLRLSGIPLAQPAQAQAKSPEARKWEYCTIVGVHLG
jgi:hypothetical protein